MTGPNESRTSLQTEIRDYNQQMEQKVNLLMHILQTSSAPNNQNAPMGSSAMPRLSTVSGVLIAASPPAHG